jgi:hypothetical protein
MELVEALTFIALIAIPLFVIFTVFLIPLIIISAILFLVIRSAKKSQGFQKTEGGKPLSFIKESPQFSITKKPGEAQGIKLVPDATLDDIKHVLGYPSAMSLIAANIVILISALFFGLSFSSIVFVYWAESGVIGVYTILKMFYAKRIGNATIDTRVGRHAYARTVSSKRVDETMGLGTAKVVMTIFFMIHYGGFMLGHLIFLTLALGVISSLEGAGTVAPAAGATLGSVIAILFFFLGLLSLFVSHGISFVKNYLGNKEYEQKSLTEVMFSPYRRIIIMHFSIFVLLLVVAPIFAVIAGVRMVSPELGWVLYAGFMTLFVTGKTLVDLASHAAERKSFGTL